MPIRRWYWILDSLKEHRRHEFGCNYFHGVCVFTTSTFWPAVSIFALTRDHLPYRSDQSFFVFASVGLDLRCNSCDGLGPFRRNVRTKTGNGRDELWGGNILSIGMCYKAHHLLNKNLVSLSYDVKKTTIRNFRISHDLWNSSAELHNWYGVLYDAIRLLIRFRMKYFCLLFPSFRLCGSRVLLMQILLTFLWRFGISECS